MSHERNRPVIGHMDKRITIQRNTAAVSSTDGTSGQLIEDWSDYMPNIWAEEVEMTGKELMRSGFTLSEDPVIWNIRWRADKTPRVTDRVRRESENFDIASVRRIGGRNRAWEILGVRRV